MWGYGYYLDGKCDHDKKNKTHVTAYSDDGDSNTTSGSKPPDTTQDQQLGCACGGYLLKTTSRS